MTARSQAAWFRPPVSVEADPRWQRVLARDRTADGQFWYSVATTGVYCRPSCPSRAANPANVGLHASLAEAKATGFRPCKRCNPDGPSAEIEHAAMIAKACRLIEASEEAPSLQALAQAANLSPSYFHRVFKRVTGLTPKAYAQGHQAFRVRDHLARGHSVTQAIYGAGFNSSGRFYEKSRTMLGMTPTQYRAGGANEAIRFAVGQSSLGAILIASSDKGVAAILIGDDPNDLLGDLTRRFPNARLVRGEKDYESMVARVIGEAEMPQIGLKLPRDVRGTAFQRRVWQALQAFSISKQEAEFDGQASLSVFRRHMKERRQDACPTYRQ
jgi:AraC family transcriptional regulator, regulatory protein of adaptative response / methylated-DNA-[protein]-cysteine methyltransferase